VPWVGVSGKLAALSGLWGLANRSRAKAAYHPTPSPYTLPLRPATHDSLLTIYHSLFPLILIQLEQAGEVEFAVAACFVQGEQRTGGGAHGHGGCALLANIHG